MTDPKSAEGHATVGGLGANSALSSERIATWRDRIKAETRASYHYEMGEAIRREGVDPSAAEDHYRRALGFLPDMVEAHFRLETLFRETNRPEDAEAAARQAKSVGPRYPCEALYRFGVQAFRRGAMDEALISLREARELNPDHGGARFHIGFILRLRGDFEAADEVAPLDLRSDDALMNEHMADLFHTRARFAWGERDLEEEALRFSRAAVVLNPELTKAHALLGLVLTYLFDPV